MLRMTAGWFRSANWSLRYETTQIIKELPIFWLTFCFGLSL